MSYRPPDEFDVRGDDTWSISTPPMPAAVQAEVGARWVKVTWQSPQNAPDAPVADYLLAVSPGSQTIRFDAETTETVLIALAPAQEYAVFVAARNAAGSSGWVSSPPFVLAYAVDAPPQGHALIDAHLFEDLLLLNDDALRVWLDNVDEVDLALAISSLPLAQRRRVIGCVRPAERAAPLREQFLPPPSTAITRPVTAQPVPVKPTPNPQPVMPRPEIVIEAPPPRRHLSFWWIALPIVLILVVVLGLLWRLAPTQDSPDLAATVAALAAAQTVVQPTPSPVVTPTEATALGPTPTPPTVTALSTVTNLPTQPAGLVAVPVLAQPAVDLVNVRSGPDETYDVRGLIPAGEEVTLLGRSEDGTWIYVLFDNVEGWVASWLLTLPDSAELAVRPTPPLPTATPAQEIVPGQENIPSAESITAQTDAAAVIDTPTAAPTSSSSPSSSTTVTQETTTNIPTGDTPTVDALTTSPCLTGGEFWLIHPVEIGVHNQVSFRWGFNAPLPDGCGFEVRIWRDGNVPAGVHDAVADNRNGVIKVVGPSEYELDVPFLHNLPAVTGSGNYWWTVALVEVAPSYRDFGRQATPSVFYVNRN